MVLSDADFRRLTDVRVHEPAAIAKALAARPRRDTLTRSGVMFIVAADHTARAWSPSAATSGRWPTVARCSTVC